MKNKKRPVIALNGANSYIGHHLLKKLTKTADIIALSKSRDNRTNSDHVTWRSCDFFSISDMEEGLAGADYAVYLLHSITSDAKLTQANFWDMEVILADNFARAAKKNGINQIIYLSGIISEHISNPSNKLQSRWEVGKILGAYGVPVTTIETELMTTAEEPHFPNHPQELPSVRSIQRVRLPEGKDANWAAEYYVHWLKSTGKPLIKPKIDSHKNCSIYLPLLRAPLLELAYAAIQNGSTYAMYFISGGILAHVLDNNSSRIEFRQLPYSQECIIAIHDYHPALAWGLYKYTQANIHLLVMYLYKRHLLSLLKHGSINAMQA